MPSRRDVEILHALFKELARIRYKDTTQWAKVSNSQKVSSYFPTPPGAGVFVNDLNQLDPMSGDGILVPAAYIKAAQTIGNIYGGILQAYKDAHWTITP